MENLGGEPLMYIVRQHNKLWAYHDVPPSLRPKVGKRRFRANLQTDDKATAKVRAAVYEA